MNANELTTADLQAMVLTAAAELAARWCADRPDNGAVIRSHLDAGAGLELLVQIMPIPAIGLRLVDSDGSYVALRTFTAK